MIFLLFVLMTNSASAGTFRVQDENLFLSASDEKGFEYKLTGEGWAYSKKNPTTHVFTGKYPVGSSLTVEEKFVIRYVANESSTMANLATFKYKDGPTKFITTSTDFDGYIQRCVSEVNPNKGEMQCNIITPEVCKAYQTGYAEMSDAEKLKCQTVIDVIRIRKSEATKKFATKAQEILKGVTEGTLGKISYNVQGFDPLDDATNCIELAKNKGLPLELYTFKAVSDKDLGSVFDKREALKPENISR